MPWKSKSETMPLPPAGGGGRGPSGPTPLPGPPINVGSPIDPGSGPIWSEQVPIYSGPINPFFIIQNFLGPNGYGGWTGLPCLAPNIGVWYEGNWCGIVANSIFDDRANALAHAIENTHVQSLNNPCTVVGFYAASATVGGGVVAAASAPEAVTTVAEAYPSLIHRLLTWINGRIPVQGTITAAAAVIRAVPATCQQLQGK